MPSLSELKNYLDSIVLRFEKLEFIEADPISIPHSFDDPEDQELIALYSALLAWGQRKTLLKNLERLCEIMNFKPRKFVYDYNIERDSHKFKTFVHRTFQPMDAIWLTNNLSLIIRQYDTLEAAFIKNQRHRDDNLGHAIQAFSELIFSVDSQTPKRLRKHLARPASGSACKRFCMYLRWVVRDGPVDLGIWKRINASSLMLPLDTHSGKQARSLGMLSRTQNDWKAALEVTENCKKLCKHDPCKYDFAFFGAGVNNYELSATFTGNQKLNVTEL